MVVGALLESELSNDAMRKLLSALMDSALRAEICATDKRIDVMLRSLDEVIRKEAEKADAFIAETETFRVESRAFRRELRKQVEAWEAKGR